jgi:tRNA threonylcarbamoyladenosine biosynthesis protein TsaE
VPAAIAAASSHGILVSDSADATRAVGARLGAAAPPGALIALVGPLGAGKTQIAKGVATGLAVASVVNSPTFILMNEHVGRLRLFHIDAYRLENAEEALAAGLFDERLADGVAVVEWADRVTPLLPAERLDITIAFGPQDATRRELHWRANGAEHVRLAGATLVGE